MKEYTINIYDDEDDNYDKLRDNVVEVKVYNKELKNISKLKEIFSFIKYLLDSGDDYASNVISVSVLESVLYSVFNNKRVFSLLGNESKKVVEEFIKFDLKNNI